MSILEAPVQDQLDRFEHRAKGAEPKIDREGGRFGAGIIRGVSLASVGEALGHEYWLDQETINQVAELANASESTGIKARFTHPGLSSDGMGRLLGRLHNVRVEGEKAVGDLHLAESAQATPDGNLSDYVIQLTEEDPQAAGLSIVFMHDFDSEAAFELEHQETVEFEDSRGRTYVTQRFSSPDPKNENDYPHVRLAELRAADIVDEPAANPGGLFDRSPLAREADGFLSYVAGISEEKPDGNSFSVDSDRASQFFARWLGSHGLTLISIKELSAMSENKEPAQPEAPQVTRESLLAEQQRYVEKFGSEDGVKWFSDGKSYEEALELFAETQSARISELEEQLATANEKISSLDVGEPEPIETHPGESKKKGFAQRIRVVGGPSVN